MGAENGHASETTNNMEYAVLRMPDGQEVKLPVLTDAASHKFVDVSALHSR